jgi:predicted nucleic acid-binding protein
MQKICFDTGVLSIYFGKDIPERKKILSILEKIATMTYEVHILSPVFSEVFYHLCKIEGKIEARTKLLSFKELYSISTIQLSDDILLKAGELKCQNRSILSFIDCFSIAYCLLEQIAFHTTETKLREIPQIISKRMNITSYKWD